ncbi:hypothetical protein FACS1894153_0010 [Bacteroidia bacterium]|nr:hypothetical protein FACS1894153_0010 [Bacteroidia bacterium]
MNIKNIIILTIILAMSQCVFGNAVAINNLSVNRDLGTEAMVVNFDVQWENSWNSDVINSYDGIWVFGKYRIDDGDWNHIYIDNIFTGTEASSIPMGSVYGDEIIDGVVTNVGVYFYSMSIGVHPMISMQSIRMEWNMGNRHKFSDHQKISIRLFAMEMVHIPAGSFDICDNSTKSRFIRLKDTLYDMSFNDLNWLKGGTPSAPEGLIETHFSNAVLPTTTSSNTLGSMINNIGLKVDNVSAATANDVWNVFGYQSVGNAQQDNAVIVSDVSNAVSTGNDWMYIQYDYNSVLPKKGMYMVFKYSGVAPTGFYVTASKNGSTFKDIAGYPNISSLENLVAGGDAQGKYIITRINEPDNYQSYRFYFSQASKGIGISFIGLYDDDSCVNMIDRNDTELYYQSANNRIDSTFPKGNENFWVMKYELTQFEWVEFLNTLNYVQQLNRTPVAPTAAIGTRLYTGRNYIKIKSFDKSTGKATYGLNYTGSDWTYNANGGLLPATGLSWEDMKAFADWACLRPLTELEYEKMCRGPQRAVPNEYAWGNSLIVSREMALGYPYSEIESQVFNPVNGLTNVAISPNGNAANEKYPVRVGMFATITTTNKLEAGASFYGILNLNDNAAEMYITVGTIEGRAFSGKNGDGKLSSTGVANTENWPNSFGAGYRGFFQNSVLTVSDRSQSRTGIADSRNAWNGFRGGRSIYNN